MIDLHRLLTDLTFQLGHSALGPARLTMARKRVARRLPKLPPATVQHVRVDFHPRDTSAMLPDAVQRPA